MIRLIPECLRFDVTLQDLMFATLGRGDKTRNVKLTTWLPVCVLAASLASVVYTVRAEEPTRSPTPSVSDTEEEETSEDAGLVSPDGKFSFLIDYSEDQKKIDLIDKKTEKVLQRIADDELSSVTYKVLWAPDSKRFALMTRTGHPNQDVRVYFLKGDKFQDIKIPDLTVEIPKKVLAGKEHPHVAANNWQVAKQWNKDGSLVLTIDNTMDGAGHTASAVRTVVLGFNTSGEAKILKSTVKYESINDAED